MINHPLVLESANVRLEPIEARHLGDLISTCNDEALWELTYADNPFTNQADAEAWLIDASEKRVFYTFAIIDKASGKAIGSTRYADMMAENRRLEIGWTFVAQSHWRTSINTECKYLLLSHAFDVLDVNRVSLKASGKNMRSRNAISRIGAAYEGTLREFRIDQKTGETDDVSYYSVLRNEWPRVKSQLAARIPDSPSRV